MAKCALLAIWAEPDLDVVLYHGFEIAIAFSVSAGGHLVVVSLAADFNAVRSALRVADRYTTSGG